MQPPDFRNGTEWIQTHTDRAFWVLDPKIEDLHILDIAHGLGNMCRYNGQCRRFYSVAEHCVHLFNAAPDEFKAWALLHDASEAYICDVPRPYKHALANYAEIEDGIMQVVARKFGLQFPMPDEVKQLDARIVVNEMTALFGTPPRPWQINQPPIPSVTIHGWPPTTAKAQFLTAFAELVAGGQLDGVAEG